MGVRARNGRELWPGDAQAAGHVRGRGLRRRGPRADEGEERAVSLIDCERHVLVPSLDDLADHLDRSWRHRMLAGEFAQPPAGPHPGVQDEGVRMEPESPEEAAAGVDPDVEHVLLVPSQALVTSGWLNHTMAAVFSAAVNDHVLERWPQ